MSLETFGCDIVDCVLLPLLLPEVRRDVEDALSHVGQSTLYLDPSEVILFCLFPLDVSAAVHFGQAATPLRGAMLNRTAQELATEGGYEYRVAKELVARRLIEYHDATFETPPRQSWWAFGRSSRQALQVSPNGLAKLARAALYRITGQVIQDIACLLPVWTNFSSTLTSYNLKTLYKVYESDPAAWREGIATAIDILENET